MCLRHVLFVHEAVAVGSEVTLSVVYLCMLMGIYMCRSDYVISSQAAPTFLCVSDGVTVW